VSRNRKCILILLFSLTLISCSRPKTISREELHSDLLAAISLASETELFINQLQDGRATSAFAEGHLAYLHQEASRSANELRRARADEPMAGALENGRTQLDSLSTMLADLKAKSDNKESLSASRQQAAKIRMNLEHVNDEL
jgi:hypothetical protein